MKSCQNCLSQAMRKGYNIDISKYQELKDYTGEALIECSEDLFQDFFLPAEELFRLQTLESAFAQVNPKNLTVLYPDNRQPQPFRPISPS